MLSPLPFLLLGAAACSSSNPDCPWGTEGCPCNEGTCEAGLSCLSNMCVGPDNQNGTGGAGDGSGGDTSTGGGTPGGGGTIIGTGGNQGTGGNSGGCTANQSSGSCSSGNAGVCEGGEWVERDCSGCNVLSCASCCGYVAGFSLTGDPYYLDNPSGLTSFSQTTSAVSADFSLSIGQIGAIPLVFSTPQYAISAVQGSIVSPGWDTQISYENNGGASGCVYSVTSGVIAAVPDDCWGSGGAPWESLSIRFVATSSGTGTMNITGVDL